MNAQAVMVEDGYQRPIMSSFHALFSLGGLFGAGGAAAAMAMGLSPGAHVSVVGLLSGCAAGLAARGLMPDRPTGFRAEPVFAVPPAALLGLGFLSFCALLAEGAIGGWSAVYLRDALGSTPVTAATRFAVFSLAMAAGRFGGDHVADRFGPVKLVSYSAALAAGGLAMSLLVGQPAVALVGFGLVGLGIANLIPALFSAAGRMPGTETGTALAAVATTGYCGYLVGPPLIGVTADVAGLPAALGLVCAACGLIAAGAVMLPPPPSCGRPVAGSAPTDSTPCDERRLRPRLRSVTSS